MKFLCLLSLLSCTSYGRFWEVDAFISCPVNYLHIKANPSMGTNADFCLAKFEMKCAADATGAACVGAPVSQASGKPWTLISQTAARNACAGIGSGYHLINNSEWMTAARNIETTPGNWSGTMVNSGNMNRGHSDNAPALSLAAAEDVDACSGTGQSCSDASWNLQRRTHQIATGEIIWDLAGNVTEWIDWQVTAAQKAYASADGNTVVAWREWTIIDTNIIAGSVMETKTWQAAAGSLTSANGIGQYFSGAANPAAANRGGAWNDVSAAGIYSLNLHETTAAQYLTVGFRCAYAR